MTEEMNYNVANSTNFKIEIPGQDAQEFNYFIQQVSIPMLSIPEVLTPHRQNYGYMPGDALEYDPLVFVFIISEDYKNYQYLVNWMKRIQRVERPKDQFRDITLHVLNNNKGGDFKIIFYNAFPTSLGDISLESAVVEPATPVCQATVRYQYFEFIF